MLILTSLFLTAVGLIYNTFIFQTIWTWFISPVFHINISYMQAMGIIVFLGFVFFKTKDLSTEDVTMEYIFNQFIKDILARTIQFFVAYVVYLLL